MENLPTLVWDIDDVLNSLTQVWFERIWMPANPSKLVCFNDLNTNPPHEILGMTLREYLSALDIFRSGPEGRDLMPHPATLKWFSQYGERYRHIALTARPLGSAPEAAEWVFRHYGRWIRGFGFVPSYRIGENLPEYHKDKADWLRWIGVGRALIDDSPTNVDSARNLGLAVITIPQPWNNAPGSIEEALGRITLDVPCAS